MTKARSSFFTWSVPTRSPAGWSRAGVDVGRAGRPVRHPRGAVGEVGDADGVLHHLVAVPHLRVVGVGPLQLGQPAPGVEVGQVGVAHVRVAVRRRRPSSGRSSRSSAPCRARRSTAASSSTTRAGVHHGCRRRGGPTGPPTPSLRAATTGSSRVGWTWPSAEGPVTSPAHPVPPRPRRRGAGAAAPWRPRGSPSRWARRRRRAAEEVAGRRRGRESVGWSAGSAAAPRSSASASAGSASAPSVGVLVGWSVSLGVSVGVGFLVGFGGSVGWWPSSGASPSTYAGSGNSSLLDALHVALHDRGPGVGRVVAAEVALATASQPSSLLVALAADVHRPTSTSCGRVAGEPRRGDRRRRLVAVPVLPAAGRPSPSAAVPVPDCTTCCSA